MNNREKSINLYLMDGDINGRIRCRLTGWMGIIYKIPRTKLAECKDMEHLKQDAVYFLFGSASPDEDDVYIGQARSRKNGNGVLGRILESHPTIDYWNEAIVFTASENYFGPTEISYLENRFYNMAKEAARYNVTNEKDPSPGKLTEEKESEMEDFIDKALMVIEAMGYKTFTPYVVAGSNANSEPLLYMQHSDAKATGVRTSEGFVVLKGSKLSKTIVPSCPENAKKYRSHYSSKINADYILTDDVLVSSASAAAAFVGGASLSGNEKWRTEDGISLKELENEITI